MLELDPEVGEVIAESFLGRLPPELLERLLDGAEVAEYPAGTVLYRGEPLPRPRLVIRGLLRVYIESREGRQVTILYARRCEFLGTPAVPLTSINVSVQVLKTARVLGVDLSKLREITRKDVRAAYATVEDLAWRLQMQVEQTRINAFGSVKQRLAWQLLDLCREPRDGVPMTIRLSQQQLADAVVDSADRGGRRLTSHRAGRSGAREEFASAQRCRRYRRRGDDELAAKLGV